MASLHFPIILGQNQEERIVIIHLTSGREDYEENRVVLTSGGENDFLFKIPQNPKGGNSIKMVDPNGREVIVENIENIKVKLEGGNADARDDGGNADARDDGGNTDAKKDGGNTDAKKDGGNADAKKDGGTADARKEGRNADAREDGGKSEGKKHDGNEEKEIGVEEYKRKLEGSFFCYYINDNTDYGFDGKIKFEINVGNDIYKGFLSIIRTTDDRVLKINVDLGSDATQAKIFNANLDGGRGQNMNLIDAINSKYYRNRRYNELVPPRDNKPKFIQQEEWNPFYYKTGNITFCQNGNLDLTEIADKDEEKGQEPKNGGATHKVESQSAKKNNEGGEGKKEVGNENIDPHLLPFLNYTNVSAACKNINSDKDHNHIWKDELAYNGKIPNIKIWYNYMEELVHDQFNVDVSFTRSDCENVYRINNGANLIPVLKCIYEQIIMAIVDAMHQFVGYKPDDVKIASVLILVPNIYDQIHIDELLYELSKLNKENERMRYDFRVISESDAAFLGIRKMKVAGAKNTVLGQIISGVEDKKQKDVFLVIDSGKGTTDYSIISYDPSNGQTYAIDRGGIAGAGSAIDYVFSRVVARQLYRNRSVQKEERCSEEEFVSRFMELIQKLPPVTQDDVMRLIELAKKEYCNWGIPAIFGRFPQSIIDSLLVKGECNLDEQLKKDWEPIMEQHGQRGLYVPVNDTDKEEITSVCSMIAQEIVDKIYANNNGIDCERIDFVVFTGRSFLFEALKEAFEKKLEPRRGVYTVNFSKVKGRIFAYLWKVMRKMRCHPSQAKKQKNGYGMRSMKRKPSQTKKQKGFFAKWKNLKSIYYRNIDMNDMKSVSIAFSERNIGYNCNSDLCSLAGLIINGRHQLQQRDFWKGFITENGDMVYYIGYKGNSFTNVAGQNDLIAMNDNLRKLLFMSLFPVFFTDVNVMAKRENDEVIDECGEISIEGDKQQEHDENSKVTSESKKEGTAENNTDKNENSIEKKEGGDEKK